MKTSSLTTLHTSIVLFVFFLSPFAAAAQTTTFTFQGRLPDAQNPQTGMYDLQFNLFDEASGTNPPLNTTPIVLEDVQVTNRTFSVALNFGSLFNTGADRYLEIGVRDGNSTGPFTVVSPRSQIFSAPYAIRSLIAATADTAINAQNLGGTSSENFVQNTDARLTDARTPTAGSGDYIQNTNSLQSGANFKIDGTGTASVFSAITQFNIGNDRVLSVTGTGNTYAGVNAGISATTAANNSFFGEDAGRDNNSGADNSFFGVQSGRQNTSGGNNTFIGVNTGYGNTVGHSNAFAGMQAGQSNTTGYNNSFFGYIAGLNNTTGNFNSALGSNANVGADNLSFATAIGSGSIANTSDTIVLGKLAGTYDGVSRPADTVQIQGNLNVAGTIAGNINGSSVTNINASNITSGTLDNARLGAIPTANIADEAITAPKLGALSVTTPKIVDSGVTTAKIADGAVTAAKIGSNQVVKNINGLTDNVNLTAGANVTLTPSGNTLTISAAGGATSPWSTNGSNVYYNLGNVGIGTDTPDVSLRVHHSSSNTNIANMQLPDLALALRNTSNANGNMSIISFQDASGFGNAQIGAVQSNQLSHSAELVFFTRDTAGASGERLRIKSNGIVVLNTLGTAGGTVLCRNASNQIANCSSSLRYKTNIAPFSFGLNLVHRLRPIRFEWKEGGMKDVGFGAEDVAAVDPLLVTYNEKGEVEGVKYDRFSAVLVNAVKEQQTQIEAQQVQLGAQQKQLERQQVVIEALKRLVCRQNPSVDLCR